MLAFQYEPIERQLRRLNPEMYKKYQRLNSIQKIAFCDHIAGQLGL